jgi:hypothetical protein
MALTVAVDPSIPERVNVTGDGFDFTVAISTDGRIDITGDGKQVEVLMDTTYPTRANIKWMGFELGWRTSPTDSLQTESKTYLPTPATPGDTVTDGVDYTDAVDEVYKYTEHVHTIPSEVLTSNRAMDRIYAYYLYPVRVSAYVSKSIARRVHFTVSGTTVTATADEVDLTGWLVAWLCKDDDDDNILYAANASYMYTIDFDDNSFTTDTITITPGYLWAEQVGKYVYFVYRTLTQKTGYFSVAYSYERLNILTGEVTSVSLGSVNLPGRATYLTIINQTHKARVTGGIMALEWYISDGVEMGVLYVYSGTGKSIVWEKVGADTIDYYHALGMGAPAGFTGNSGSGTHLLAFIDAWSTTRYYCGYAHLDDVFGIHVGVNDTAYDDLGLPSRSNKTDSFIECSSKHVTDPYFIDSEGVDVVIRSGLDGSVYTTLDPADYDCDALYPSWLYSSSDGISGNYSSLSGNTRDDIDDSIYIFGKRTSDLYVDRILGIDEDGNLIKDMDIISALWKSYAYGFTSSSSTSQSMIVDTRYYLNSGGHYSFYRGVRYFYPWAPNYTR